jgi:hypothetical protein
MNIHVVVTDHLDPLHQQLQSPPFFDEPGGALAPTEVLLKVKVQIYSTKPDERREEES